MGLRAILDYQEKILKLEAEIAELQAVNQEMAAVLMTGHELWMTDREQIESLTSRVDEMEQENKKLRRRVEVAEYSLRRFDKITFQ